MGKQLTEELNNNENGSQEPEEITNVEQLKKEVEELREWKAEMQRFVADQNQINSAFSKAINAFGDFVKAIQTKFNN